MAIYGNKTTMSGEVNPNNFATRPGVFPSTHPAPSHDYLFGSNMGLPEEENNLSISKARIKSILPYPLNFGNCAPGHLSGTIFSSPLGFVAVGAVAGSYIATWHAGGAYTKGRSNDIWGAAIGATIGALAAVAAHPRSDD